ncbi:MAG TPA: YetF domain-containing protein [Gaiellaceae bacterium]|nr:YetF domain-containing protein [Gaiellaceae bacterium]
MDIVIRAAVAYVFIIFLLRIVGRRELSTLAPSDLVLLVVMGDLVQNGVTQSDQSVTGVFLALSTFALLTLAVSVVTFKSRRVQTLVEGAPLILVQDGKPVEKNLRSERLNVDDVAEEARGQGIERLDEIKWCVLETSGSMSFIKAA